MSAALGGVRTTLLAATAVGAVAACSDEEEEPPAAEALALDEVPAGAPLEVEETPSLDVGVAEGAEAEELHDLGPPFLLTDGSVGAPVRGVSAVHVFGRDGHLRWSLGREGGGPGEFRGLRAAWARGDTVEAFDPRAGRVTRFLEGELLETVRIPDASGHTLEGAHSDGWVLGNVVGGGLGRHRDELAYHDVGRDGERRERIATSSGIERVMFDGFSGPPALSPGGKAAVHDDRLYVAELLRPVVEVYALSGELDREIHWEPQREWDPEEARSRIARALEEGAEHPRDPGRRLYEQEWVEAVEPPEQAPAFSDFMVDEEGFLWIRPYVPERDSPAVGGNPAHGRTSPGGEWRILSSEGIEVSRVTVPDGFDPHVLAEDEILGIHWDELGVERLRAYPLDRAHH